MGALLRRTVWSVSLIAALAFTVVLLAALQYRWITELAEAERERLEARLAVSMEFFRELFHRELFQSLAVFRREPWRQPGVDWNSFARSYEDWREFAAHPELVTSFWAANITGRSNLRALRFDEIRHEFTPAVLPEPVAHALRTCVAPADQPPFRGGMWTFAFADGRPFLMRGVYRMGLAGGRPPAGPPHLEGYLFYELNGQFIRQEVFPELARRAFGELESSGFRIAVFQGEAGGQPIYRSDPQTAPHDFAKADATIALLWDERIQPRGPDRGGGFRPRWRSVVSPCRPGDQWILVARHQAGSVSQAVESFRRRNLAISGGVLILLSLSIFMTVVWAQRAQRLARMQMQFAAGISHEVRTPLAVIRSAADNLAEGVVESPAQVREYGDLIRREGRRLSGLVEEAMQFASLHAGRKRFELKPVDVTAVIRGALNDLAPVIEESGFTIEQFFDGELPAVRADARALSQCVQNLVTNALKYGGAARWIGVRAWMEDGDCPVKVSVQDRGPGIAAEDLPYIFDPFYQGDSPDGTKSRGVGLGLSLTREMMDAMGGRVTVETRQGRGTTFTLHLRAAGGAVSSDGSENSRN